MQTLLMLYQMHPRSARNAVMTCAAKRGRSEERGGRLELVLKYADRKYELTSLAHLRPQELHKSRCPLGPLRHSGVTLVWQFAQSFCWSLPRLRFRFFFAASND